MDYTKNGVSLISNSHLTGHSLLFITVVLCFFLLNLVTLQIISHTCDYFCLLKGKIMGFLEDKMPDSGAFTL
jgi:hypothetical protein